MSVLVYGPVALVALGVALQLLRQIRAGEPVQVEVARELAIAVVATLPLGLAAAAVLQAPDEYVPERAVALALAVLDAAAASKAARLAGGAR